jgi:hypothetical protein
MKEPMFVGHTDVHGGWWVFSDAPDDRCPHWWDIRGWTWEDCAEFLHEPSDAHRMVCLALSPKVW